MGIHTAIERAGGAGVLAERLGVSYQAVMNWTTRESGVPPNKCKAIEAETGVSVRELRPSDWRDYWPEAAASESA